MLPKQLKNHAAQRASTLATPKMVAKVLGLRLCRELPRKIMEKGVNVNMEEVFREGPYVVLRMQVIHVDTVALAETATIVGTETTFLGEWVDFWMDVVGVEHQRKIEEDYCKSDANMMC